MVSVLLALKPHKPRGEPLRGGLPPGVSAFRWRKRRGRPGALHAKRHRGQRGVMKNAFHPAHGFGNRRGGQEIGLDKLDPFPKTRHFLRCPVLKLSKTRTRSPRATNASAMCEPIKPAPPVTKKVRMVSDQWLVIQLVSYFVTCLAARIVGQRTLAPGIDALNVNGQHEHYANLSIDHYHGLDKLFISPK